MNTIDLFNSTSYLCSKTITVNYSSSFSSAIKLFHPELHAPIHGIYGFVRLADEIVDTFHNYPKAILLAQFKKDTFDAIDQKISLNPILQSFQLTVNQYNIGHELIEAFFDSMHSDLEKKDWTTKEELSRYIYGSAEVVGLMCLQVFCDGNYEQAKMLAPAATSLGAAFQKVNFLRDLADDLKNLERSYFPQIDLHCLSRSEKELIEMDISKDFERAYAGILQLPAKARFGVLVAYKYYFCLFQKIKGITPEQLLSSRVSVPPIKKMLLLLQMKVGNRLGFQ